MPSLDQATAAPVTKLLLIGESSAGKTGALASLVGAGYKLRILDMDNKIKNGILPIVVKRDYPDKLKNIEYESLRDNFKGTAAGHVFDGQPTAYTKALALMDKWSDGTIPKNWGSEFVFVLDSLSFFADAAFNWAKSMNPSSKEPRQWYGTAQQGVLHTMSVLSADSFNCNVVVVCHVAWHNRADGTMKGLPASVGQAIDSDIPTYFENMALCQIMGGKRQIQTLPTALIDLKSPAAFKLAPTLPIETGLATFFQTLRT